MNPFSSKLINEDTGAPVSSFISLEENGFILDPNGIRVMGYKL